MDYCMKNKLPRIENFILNKFREILCTDFIENSRDEAWKNKDMDHFNVPKQPELCWHNMMTSLNGNISALLAICAGNSPVTGELPAQRSVTQSFDVFFDLCPNERLSKQTRGRWFETPSRPLWRHSNEFSFFFSASSRFGLRINSLVSETRPGQVCS